MNSTKNRHTDTLGRGNNKTEMQYTPYVNAIDAKATNISSKILEAKARPCGLHVYFRTGVVNCDLPTIYSR